MPLPPDVLGCLREAGRIAAAARRHGEALIRPGALLRDVCESVEEDIRRRGGFLAFPVQSSRNMVAAHYCASPEDDTTYGEGDLAKLDIGVHIDGWVVDTAITVVAGDAPSARPLVQAAEQALEAAIAATRPGVPVKDVSLVIEETLRRHGARPLRNLCGHGVGRWTVHCPPPIPNVGEGAHGRLEAGAVVAIEPFATHGRGHVIERGEPQVFRLDPRRDRDDAGDAAVLAAIRSFRGLPFARRQLAAVDRGALEDTLAALRRSGALTAYPPLVEGSGQPVAQAEHTIHVGSDGVEVLTR